jgi:hypothetical protein
MDFNGMAVACNGSRLAVFSIGRSGESQNFCEPRMSARGLNSFEAGGPLTTRLC